MKKETSKNGLEIAVIGMAGRFPGAKNIPEFWENLTQGIESINFFSERELELEGISPELIRNPNYVKAKGFLEHIENFDYSFFGYTYKEAELMDPQVRIFHECVWEAIENAGYNLENYPGLVGVFGGASNNFYWELSAYNQNSAMGQFAVSQLCDKDFLSARIAHKFNLKGPAITIQTACSTSLVAIHLSCQSLLSGECDMALAGGVSVILPQKMGYLFQDGMVLSPDGHCRTFDIEAKGLITGNGIGVVLLKRLDDAIASGDHIYAMIKGSAINNDGIEKASFTAPSREGQASVIRAALQMAEIDAESISYVETHGTATTIGDPIEVNALKIAFNTEKRGFCGVGSVKTNIGHLNAAAGVASFIKTVLALENKVIPPSLNFQTPNPKIGFENSPFYVNTDLSGWENALYPLRAGVSSFGIGGTNSHVILEEPPERALSSVAGIHQIVPISARNNEVADQITKNLLRYCEDNPNTNIADLAYTLQMGRKEFACRSVFVCKNIKELIDLLKTSSEYSVVSDNEKPVIFMFPGLGTQYLDMGLDLYREIPFFREEVERCFALFKKQTGSDLKSLLTPAPDSLEFQNKLDEALITEPLVFIFEYGLAKLLINWGIKPQKMIGYGIGEYVAATVAGVFSLPDALKLVSIRSQLIQKTQPGVMLDVQINENTLKPMLPGNLALAAINSPQSCLISGDETVASAFEAELKSKGYECSRLRITHAYQWVTIDAMIDEFKLVLELTKMEAPQIDFISNLTGKFIRKEEITSIDYWLKQLRQMVHLSVGFTELLKDKQGVFIEVGFEKSLSLYLKQHDLSVQIFNLIEVKQQQVNQSCGLIHQISQLWRTGIKINWEQLHKDEKRYRIPLPTYPFETHTFPSKVGLELPSAPKKELVIDNDLRSWFYQRRWKETASLDEFSAEAISGNVLMFVNEEKINEEISAELNRKGCHVTIVKCGKEFSEENDHSYRINPDEMSDYELLFKELHSVNEIPTVIVHTLGISNETEPAMDSLEENLNQVFFSLVYIAKIIGRLKLTQHIFIRVITSGIFDVTGGDISPIKATTIGPIKVINQEYPNLFCNCIDLKIGDSENLLNQLMNEILTKSKDDIIVYRDGRRFIPVFEKLAVENVIQKKILVDEGFYLITGGLGNIGYILAEFLTKNCNAKLVLLGREKLPDRVIWEDILKDDYDKFDTFYGPENSNRFRDFDFESGIQQARRIESGLEKQLAVKDITSYPGPKQKRLQICKDKILKIQELEKNGSEIAYFDIDVSDYGKMKDLLEKVESKYGRLNGVIHAAAELEGKLINEITKEDCFHQFKTKIFGTRVLTEILKNKDFDFCILMSSISTVLGGLGFVAYSAANLFMDSIAYYNHKKYSQRWISINWDSWESRMTNQNTFGLRVADTAIKADEGIKVFQSVLESGTFDSQIYISTTNLHKRINQWVQLDNVKDFSQGDSGPTPFAEGISTIQQVEQILIKIWKNILGVRNINIENDFFDLGGDSLMLNQLSTNINKHFKNGVKVQDLYDNTSIKKLTVLIAGRNDIIQPQNEDKIQSIDF